MAEPDPRSPMSVGMAWATRAGSLGLEFGLPALLGGYVDGRWGTGHTFLLIGMVLGFSVGMMHILQIARGGTKSP